MAGMYLLLKFKVLNQKWTSKKVQKPTVRLIHSVIVLFLSSSRYLDDSQDSMRLLSIVVGTCRSLWRRGVQVVLWVSLTHAPWGCSCLTVNSICSVLHIPSLKYMYVYIYASKCTICHLWKPISKCNYFISYLFLVPQQVNLNHLVPFQCVSTSCIFILFKLEIRGSKWLAHPSLYIYSLKLHLILVLVSGTSLEFLVPETLFPTC